MEILLIGFIAVVTFLTRVINLLNIPIFTDEAIYIRWAQIGLNDPAHRYISLTDGKQPLLTWLMYPTLTIFSDPLFAGRFVSVIASVLSVIGIYMVGRELFGRKAAIFSALLYLISPFFVLYDRLALMDSLLVTTTIWSLYLEILLVRKLRLDTALLLGIVMGLGLMTKSSAFFYLYLLPASLLLFDFKAKHRWKKFFKWVLLASLSFVFAQIMYNSLRLSPWFYIIEQKNYTFIYTLSEFLKSPFFYLIPNLRGLLDFLFTYLTLPVDIVLLFGLAYYSYRGNKIIFYLILWFLIPFLSLASFGKVLFPRFLLFMSVPLLFIAAKTITDLFDFSSRKRRILLILIPLILIYPAFQSFLLVTHPVKAAIHQTDRNQLFDDWPAGVGVNEVISYINNQSKMGKVVLGTEGTFGLNPAVYEIYLGSNNNVEIKGFWPVSKVPEELLAKSRIYPTYLVFKETQKVPSDWPLDLVAKYRRGKGNTYLLFYRVDPRKVNISQAND